MAFFPVHCLAIACLATLPIATVVGAVPADDRPCGDAATESTALPRRGGDSSGHQDDPLDTGGFLGLGEASFRKHGAIVYQQGDDYRLTCDIYVPQREGPLPAILAVHGGAWRSGTKLHMVRHAWKLADAGYVVMAINYRHAPQYPFPAQILDCKAAVRWMRDNAQAYKIDPARIGAFGYSAGGHLVAMLGATDSLAGFDGDDGSTTDLRLQAVAVGAGPCDFSRIRQDVISLRYWLGATRGEDPTAYDRASPVNYVSSDDPPFYFYHGSEDLLVDPSNSRIMHQRLLEAGCRSQYTLVQDSGHFATFSNLDTLDGVIEFFDDVLAAQPSK